LPDWEAVSNQQTSRTFTVFITKHSTTKNILYRYYVSCPCVDSVFIRSGHYNLIGVDVRKEQKVEAALSEAGLQWDTPTLVLSEVVLTYMETQW